MRKAIASASALAAAATLLAGCGGSSRKVERTFDTFLSGSQGASWARRFPHTPGGRPCTVRDPQLKQVVAATCSTALSVADSGLVLATFTISWNHGSDARTWFVFLDRDGKIDHISRAGAAG